MSESPTSPLIDMYGYDWAGLIENYRIDNMALRDMLAEKSRIVDRRPGKEWINIELSTLLKWIPKILEHEKLCPTPQNLRMNVHPQTK